MTGPHTGVLTFGQGCMHLRIDSGLWQGTCTSLDFLFISSSETYSSSAPCMYMNKDDLYWHYDDCSSKHYVVCQVQNGVCEYDDQNMAIDKSLSSLSSVPSSTLDECKTECQNYINGEEQCWAIKYQNSANKCYMYVSVKPQDYFSSTSNKNKNIFYSTRECFSSSIVEENEPSITTDIDTIVESCLPTTTSTLESTNVPVISTVSTQREQLTTYLTTEKVKYSTAISTIQLLTTIILGETTSIITDSSITTLDDTAPITSNEVTTTLKTDETTTLSIEGATTLTGKETTTLIKEETTTLTINTKTTLTEETTLTTDKTTTLTTDKTTTLTTEEPTTINTEVTSTLPNERNINITNGRNNNI
ncbi:unnamed protein product [Mytilus coruscus]|uniref:Apple domain-containing protein n=1 Tax=Mytilus coruscus TaxID=42192 RepID=A0A6J8CY59_MYTCO|nr:unnamed protein product [Mytilus coruscus]